MRFRSFISVDIDPTDSLLALLEGLRRTGADLKMVRPENLHVTLRFLGDIDDSAVDEIARIMRESVTALEPFRGAMKGMGAFPSLSNIRVIWIGLENVHELSVLAERLDSSLRKLDFERDKKGFKPHLTVARTRSSRNLGSLQDLINSNVATDFGQFDVDSVKLKRSVLTPHGPRYSDVRETALGGS